MLETANRVSHQYDNTMVGTHRTSNWKPGVPLQRVPKAADDGGAVRAGDGFPLGAADVMQDVVASLHGYLHPGGSLGGVERPGGGCEVLDVHVVFP